MPFVASPASPLQALLSITCPIPSIFERLDCSKFESAAKRKAVARGAAVEFNKILATMSSSLQDVMRSPGQATYWDIVGDDGETSIWFSSISVANLLTHFWAFWIICVTNIRSIISDYPDLQSLEILIDGQTPGSTFVTQKIASAANDILLSMEFLVQDKMKLFGAASLVLPLRVARSVYNTSTTADGDAYSRCCKRIERSKYRDILLL